MRIAGANAALRADDADQAGELATAALEHFRAMEAKGWYRRCEELLRGLGRRAPTPRTGPGPAG
jgi:hypothetical protein